MPHLTILGGGIAGLSVGYFASKRSLPFTIYEARDRWGGNCITLSHDGFRFDSGAHRFHDKDAAITAELKGLLGTDLHLLVRPSKIFSQGDFLEYPISLIGVLRDLGIPYMIKAAADVARSRLRSAGSAVSFEDYAIKLYGKTVAERFFLRYTEKLWGVPCSLLQPGIAAKRFQGFGLKALFDPIARILKPRACPSEGIYYYPENGIGTISDALGAFCSEEDFRRSAPVTRLIHDSRQIRQVEIGGREFLDVEAVVSTIPLDQLIRDMDPAAPRHVLEAAMRLRFRNVILVAFFLDRESVSEAAVLYFADPDFSIIRVYEPKNRNSRMSPKGKTSLVAEIPCSPEDKTWILPDSFLTDQAKGELIRAGLLRGPEVLGSCVHRMPYAYPIPEKALQEKLEKLLSFLGTFSNLKLLGRCGTWRYLWMHELMAGGRSLIDSYR